MILTDKERMLLTPTYHVFDMYQPFQGATQLAAELTAPEYKLGDVSIPSLSVSSAKTGDGKIVLSLVNTDPNKPARVTAKIAGASPSKISATVLTTPAMNAHNTFEKPDMVAPAAFTGAKKKGDAWIFDLPSKSVVVATLN